MTRWSSTALHSRTTEHSFVILALGLYTYTTYTLLARLDLRNFLGSRILATLLYTYTPAFGYFGSWIFLDLFSLLHADGSTRDVLSRYPVPRLSGFTFSTIRREKDLTKIVHLVTEMGDIAYTSFVYRAWNRIGSMETGLWEEHRTWPGGITKRKFEPAVLSFSPLASPQAHFEATFFTMSMISSLRNDHQVP